ncbi:MAG: hypothetical protein A3B07_02120 [Candidatus Yonathbacteria bacterium RIFCSPLOWO2_01_FULL_43_27]|uniref:Uncharacterized protein n=2 Tax=Parcubacteria group TaxID=1794811 RepID=A0A1G2SD34_9BACT|nr:MAG: hypothetical protein UW78_C0001G0029 [Candidatus Azambacteria bacterium GW2011_GWA1_44_9]OHA78573.1 MAG: hypothetical protein A2658_02175 [Candidatus Yonathbacteria bacterium RIFCSPHIGHO2_01_FULL_44_19]OHA82311.1 MAG: hypothetical protein A3B07_02120 [Candidatus Yonathbacteria bacterium RIFCSPLOWO2_01_FULL_43_27]
MHRALMLQGLVRHSKAQVRITGILAGKPSDVLVGGYCVKSALDKMPSLLENEATIEVNRMLCFNEIRSPHVSSFLDYWAREKEMSFFVWKNQQGQFLVLFVPASPIHFEVSEFLEEHLGVMSNAPGMRCMVRENKGTLIDITRVKRNALELFELSNNFSELHVGYIGLGESLREAIRGVSGIIP